MSSTAPLRAAIDTASITAGYDRERWNAKFRKGLAANGLSLIDRLPPHFKGPCMTAPIAVVGRGDWRRSSVIVFTKDLR